MHKGFCYKYIFGNSLRENIPAKKEVQEDSVI